MPHLLPPLVLAASHCSWLYSSHHKTSCSFIQSDTFLSGWLVMKFLPFFVPPLSPAGSGDSASELLVSMGSGTSLEDFYPSIAINALMRILKDQSLSQHHTMAIQALGFIFKSLGIKSVPYLPQVGGVEGGAVVKRS